MTEQERKTERGRIILTAAWIYAHSSPKVSYLEAVRAARTLIATVDGELAQVDLDGVIS